MITCLPQQRKPLLVSDYKQTTLPIISQQKETKTVPLPRNFPREAARCRGPEHVSISCTAGSIARPPSSPLSHTSFRLLLLLSTFTILPLPPRQRGTVYLVFTYLLFHYSTHFLFHHRNKVATFYLFPTPLFYSLLFHYH